MRLLSRRDGKLRFSSFEPPSEQYAIISHRWLPKEEEVLYSDVLKGAVSKPGYQKVDFCLDQAAKDGYKSVWIDSCCINQSDTAELSTSLNSMFKWYSSAAICYVYLGDVPYNGWTGKFGESAWFKRGWTLQELVAPDDVRFYSCDRQYLGNKVTLAREIAAVTKIEKPLKESSIVERFSWSLGRETTVPEDKSYCMLGLLEVTMDPRYGEGAENAENRLLDEVAKEYGRRAQRQLWLIIARRAEATSVHAEEPGDSKAESMLHPSTDIESLLEALRFDNMNLRRGAIDDPCADTCTWLLKHHTYRQWYERVGDRFLWIKGKAGTGKSTLVKYADLSANDCPCISFYFNARGTKLEQSVLGLYRSLLFQLLHKISGVGSVVLESLRQELQYTGSTELSLSTVRTFFRQVALKLQSPVRCFIDALDECADEEVQEMVHLLEDISQQAPLYICFASRYYPAILIESPEILLEKQREHGSDLGAYVNSRLRSSDDLKQQVVKKANGVFLWAVLVIKELNAKISKGAIYSLQETLDALPEKLTELLQSITCRTEDLERFRICIQTLLFANEILDVVAFCILVLVGLSDTGVDGSTRVAESILHGQVSAKQMKQWVAIWSRGLAEVVWDFSDDDDDDHDLATAPSWSTVQVIHESVRDFFLLQNGRTLLSKNAETGLESQAHDALKRSCQGVLELDCAGLFHSGYWPRTSRCVHYSSQNVFLHAELAASRINQDEFVTSFNHERYELGSNLSWLRMPTMWHGFVDANAIQLIRTAKRLNLRPKATLRATETSTSVLYLAASLGNYSVVEALLDCGLDLEEPSQPERRTALGVAAIKQPSVCKLLLDHGACQDAQDWKGLTILHTAILGGYHLSFSVKTWTLNATYYDVYDIQPDPGDFCHISHFRKRGKVNCDGEIVKLLLEHNVDLTLRDIKGRTALMFAALVNSDLVVRWLLDLGTNTEEIDNEGNTALLLACFAGQSASVQCLLPAGADAHVKNFVGITSLLATCTHDGFEAALGHAMAITDIAFESEARYISLGMPPAPQYLNCVHACDIEIVHLLLEYAVDINAQDSQGRTALLAVCERAGGLHLAELLLDNGADPNIEDCQGRNALRVAVDNLQRQTAAMLIRRGANVLNIDKQGTIALSVILVKSSIKAHRHIYGTETKVNAIFNALAEQGFKTLSHILDKLTEIETSERLNERYQDRSHILEKLTNMDDWTSSEEDDEWFETGSSEWSEDDEMH